MFTVYLVLILVRIEIVADRCLSATRQWRFHLVLMTVNTLDIKTRRRMAAILRVLRDAESSIGSERIAHALALTGITLSERAVRNYLAQMDTLGWTRNLGRRGRQLTEKGFAELESALVVDKVGFIAAKVDELSYQMDFDVATRRGKVILNISTVDATDASKALQIMGHVYKARLGMGRLLIVADAGYPIGDFRVPEGKVGIGTVCSVSLNGILLHANIALASRFGGLLELEQGRPGRFTQIINYDGSSLDPLEIFIRSHMTSVMQAARTGNGALGASFREAPAAALPEVRRLIREADKLGMGGVLAVGSPDQPLLDIPVTVGRVGMIVCGGLNPVSAVVEAGIHVDSAAMSALCDYSLLREYREAVQQHR